MPETNETKESEAPKKKLSLKEAIQKQLEVKQNQISTTNTKGNTVQSAKKMQSQQVKKVSTARRKMGS